jgi:hypothetical protein
MEHTDTNRWFREVNANAMSMINQRKYTKKHNPYFNTLGFKQSILELKPKLEIYINYIRNKIKIRTPFTKQHSMRSFRIRKLTSLENEK